MSAVLSSKNIHTPHTTAAMDKNNSNMNHMNISNNHPLNTTDRQQSAILGGFAAQNTIMNGSNNSGSNDYNRESGTIGSPDDDNVMNTLKSSPGTIYAQLLENNSTTGNSLSTSISPRMDSTNELYHNIITRSNSSLFNGVNRSPKLRTYSHNDTPSPEPTIPHCNKLEDTTCVNYSQYNNNVVCDFTVTLNTEPNVSFELHSNVLRQHSEFFDGVLHDEPDRQSIELQFIEQQFTSGDIKLYFDMLYKVESLNHVSSDKLILIAQLSSYFDSSELLHKCEMYLTNIVSPKTLSRTISQPKAQSTQTNTSQSTRIQSTGYSSAAIESNNTLVNLALADRLHMNELKTACINDLASNGFSEYKDEPQQLNDTLQQLSHNTLTEVIQAVIEQKF